MLTIRINTIAQMETKFRPTKELIKGRKYNPFGCDILRFSQSVNENNESRRCLPSRVLIETLHFSNENRKLYILILIIIKYMVYILEKTQEI